MIRVTKISMENFRGIEKLLIDFHPRINVIVGVNGIGKSSILDCLSILLARFFSKIGLLYASARMFSDLDVSNGQDFTWNGISITYNDDNVRWEMGRSARRKRQRIRTIYASELNQLASKIVDGIMDGSVKNVPFAVYYPTNRAVFDIPLRIRRKHDFEQLSVYDSALDGKRNDFRIFFEWFRKREDYENEIRLSGSVDRDTFRDRQLESVRKAVEHMLPGFSELRISRYPNLRMLISKNNYELCVNQLSDGEKCLIAMIGDLARRLAIANPALENPLEGSAIVLIDEIELHLHPKWQSMIVGALSEIFHNCQFVISSHSPHVLTHIEKESIFLVDRMNGVVEIKHPKYSYGQTVGRILEDFMDSLERPNNIKIKMTNLFKTIKEKDKKSANEQLEALYELIGDDPELTKARILTKFL